jgi:hypothetical protein
MRTKPKPRYRAGVALFITVLGLVSAFFIALLQANGVSVNWWVSAGLYSLILSICVWSLLRHAVPDHGSATKVVSSGLLIVVIGGVGVYAVTKQYRADRQVQLPAVRVEQWGVTASDGTAFATIDASRVTEADKQRGALFLIVRGRDDWFDFSMDPIIDKSTLFDITTDQIRITVPLGQPTLRRLVPKGQVEEYLLFMPKGTDVDRIQTIREARSHGGVLIGRAASNVEVGPE